MVYDAGKACTVFMVDVGRRKGSNFRTVLALVVRLFSCVCEAVRGNILPDREFVAQLCICRNLALDQKTEPEVTFYRIELKGDRNLEPSS